METDKWDDAFDEDDEELIHDVQLQSDPQEDAEVEDLLPALAEYTQGSDLGNLVDSIVELIEDVEYASALKCIEALKNKLVS